MSDTSQGPGWWQASDGKWYAPELYPKDWPAPNAGSGDEAATDSGTGGSAAAPTSSPLGSPGDAGADPTLRSWGALDPAAGEPTLVEGMPAVPRISDPEMPPTARHEALTPPATPVWEPPPVVAPPIAGSTDWDSPAAPPSSWHAPAAAHAGTPAVTTGSAASAPDIPGGLLALASAAALVVGSLLAWAKAVGPDVTGEVNGLTGSNGWGTLIAGLGIAGAGALALGGIRKVWVGAALAAGALVGLGLAVFSVLDINSTSDDLPATLRDRGIPPEIADSTSLDLDIGIWIVLAGAAAALLASIVVLARRR